MCLEFGDDFCAACEPTARIWHEGHDPVGRRPIAIIVVDVDLQEIQYGHQPASVSKHSTHSLGFIECAIASNKVVSARKTHVEISKMETFVMGKEGKESARRPEHPKLWQPLFVYFYTVPTCLSFLLQPSSSSFSFLGGLSSLVGGLCPLACWLCLEPTSFTPKQ